LKVYTSFAALFGHNNNTLFENSFNKQLVNSSIQSNNSQCPLRLTVRVHRSCDAETIENKSSDGGDSGSRKCKRDYGGVYGGVWLTLRLAGIWSQAVGFELVRLAGIWLQSL
jgi:hypothetical protein